jgi:hypothetical protein
MTALFPTVLYLELYPSVLFLVLETDNNAPALNPGSELLYGFTSFIDYAFYLSVLYNGKL